MIAATPYFPTVPDYMVDEKKHRKLIAQSIQSITQGKINVNQTITLRASNTTTVIQDARISSYSAILLTPLTAHAATAYVAGIYVTNQMPANGTTPGQATLNHASSANIDQNFTLTILG